MGKNCLWKIEVEAELSAVGLAGPSSRCFPTPMPGTHASPKQVLRRQLLC